MRHLEFLGNVIRYGVAVGTETVVVDAPHQGGETAFPVGTQVTVSLKREQILALGS